MIFGNYTDKLYKFPHSLYHTDRGKSCIVKNYYVYAWGIQWYISNKQVISDVPHMCTEKIGHLCLGWGHCLRPRKTNL